MPELTGLQRQCLREVYDAGGSKLLPLSGPNIVRQLHERGLVETADDWRVELTE
jgi:Mn-dependent DtxR family transcriptional regulator